MAYDRERYRQAFNTVAGLYDQARPDYPEELYSELIRAASLTPGSELLEIGCATGKATMPLARRGFQITCLELGAELSAAARRNLAAFPGVDVITADAETWQPPAGMAFDLVFAATSWHWIDPERRYQKAWALLRPGGHLAFWGAMHVFPEDADLFFYEIQDVYDEIGEGLPPGTAWPPTGELPDERADIEESGLFSVVTIWEFDWETSYDADGYIRLLDTFSGHIMMEQWQRDRLYGEIRRRLAARPDGRLRRHWGAVLHVARRRDVPSPA